MMILWVPGCVSLAFPEVLYTVFNDGIQQKNIFQSSASSVLSWATQWDCLKLEIKKELLWLRGRMWGPVQVLEIHIHLHLCSEKPLWWRSRDALIWGYKDNLGGQFNNHTFIWAIVLSSFSRACDLTGFRVLPQLTNSTKAPSCQAVLKSNQKGSGWWLL